MLSWVTAIVAWCSGIGKSEIFIHTLRVILLVSPLAVLGCIMAFRCDIILKVKIFRKLYEWLDRLSHGAVRRIEEALAAYRPKWQVVLLWTLLSGFLAFPLIVLSVWFIAIAALGWSTGSAPGSLIGSLLSGSIGELAGILPLTPGGIGVRDAVFAEIFKFCGLPGDTAMVIPVVFTTLFVLASSTGALFALHMLLTGKKRSHKN